MRPNKTKTDKTKSSDKGRKCALSSHSAPKVGLSTFKYVGMAGKIAFGLMAPIIAACFIGIYLDGRLNTTPWLTVTLLLLGLVAGFGGLYSMLKKDI
ncbi:MAG: AtpZ/AtpI family protein [Candidatus Poribacteria bacterium]